MFVKIFEDYNIKNLEAKISEWLANLTAYKVSMVTQSQSENKEGLLVVISIWYEEKYIKGKIPKSKLSRWR